ncbi:MAG: hypothetical protein R6T83_03305 [Salinibacter sp.]
MTDTVYRISIDRPPRADQIAAYREEANDRQGTLEVTFPVGEITKRLVVSPRGTVVLLNDVSEETFNRSESPETIAAALAS